MWGINDLRAFVEGKVDNGSNTLAFLNFAIEEYARQSPLEREYIAIDMIETDQHLMIMAAGDMSRFS
jgi:hypothetical protein